MVGEKLIVNHWKKSDGTNAKSLSENTLGCELKSCPE